MKNLLSVVIIAILCFNSQGLKAQKVGQTSLGVKTAFQYSTMDVEGLSSLDFFKPTYFNSYSVGLMSQVEMGGGFFFRPELNYTEKGIDMLVKKDLEIFKVEVSLGGEFRTRMSYIDMPLNLGYRIDMGKTKLQFYAGPTLGYAIKSEVNTYIDASLLKLKVDTRGLNLSSDNYHRFDLGLNVGTSFVIPVRTGSIVLDARFSNSLTDFMNDPLIDLQLRHQSFAFGIGYMYKFGRKEQVSNIVSL